MTKHALHSPWSVIYGSLLWLFPVYFGPAAIVIWFSPLVQLPLGVVMGCLLLGVLGLITVYLWQAPVLLWLTADGLELGHKHTRVPWELVRGLDRMGIWAGLTPRLYRLRFHDNRRSIWFYAPPGVKPAFDRALTRFCAERDTLPGVSD